MLSMTFSVEEEFPAVRAETVEFTIDSETHSCVLFACEDTAVQTIVVSSMERQHRPRNHLLAERTRM